MSLFYEGFIVLKFWRFFLSALLLFVAMIGFAAPGGDGQGLGILALFGIAVVIGSALIPSDSREGGRKQDIDDLRSKDHGELSHEEKMRLQWAASEEQEDR